MRASAAFLRTAELIANDIDTHAMLGACLEMCKVIGRHYSRDDPLVAQFTDICQPPHDCCAWWNFDRNGYNERVLALLFAHQVALDSEREIAKRGKVAGKTAGGR